MLLSDGWWINDEFVGYCGGGAGPETRVRGRVGGNNNKDGKELQPSHQRSDSTILVKSSIKRWCYQVTVGGAMMQSWGTAVDDQEVTRVGGGGGGDEDKDGKGM